jgi:hypothetical protein
MEKDLEQIMVKVKFKGDIVRIKTSIAEGVEIDADNKIITVINIPDPYADDNHQD